MEQLIKRNLRYIKSFLLYNYFITRNRRLDYFRFKKLAVSFPIFSLSNEPGIIGNKCYGNFWAVKKALGKKFQHKCMIEHGLYFGEYVIKNECQIKGLKTIYTYSEYRRNALKKANIDNIEIKTIGPYISYVKNFNTKSHLKKLKNRYGKILLVFPYHSTPELKNKYDIDLFIKKIKEIAINYDAVFVSLFWLDIVNQNYRKYADAGFTIVSSGHRNDPFFLNRLRDLIDLADMTMSNDIGTHIGYCISLGKPHYLYRQEIIEKVTIKKETDNFDDNYKEIFHRERQIFSEVFSSPKQEIKEEQKNLVEFYWGKCISKNKVF